jgi:hypothetical protein
MAAMTSMMRKALSTGTMDAVSAERMFLSAVIRPKSRITLQGQEWKSQPNLKGTRSLRMLASKENLTKLHVQEECGHGFCVCGSACPKHKCT